MLAWTPRAVSGFRFAAPASDPTGLCWRTARGAGYRIRRSARTNRDASRWRPSLSRGAIIVSWPASTRIRPHVHSPRMVNIAGRLLACSVGTSNRPPELPAQSPSEAHPVAALQLEHLARFIGTGDLEPKALDDLPRGLHL